MILASWFWVIIFSLLVLCFTFPSCPRMILVCCMDRRTLVSQFVPPSGVPIVCEGHTRHKKAINTAWRLSNLTTKTQSNGRLWAWGGRLSQITYYTLYNTLPCVIFPRLSSFTSPIFPPKEKNTLHRKIYLHCGFLSAQQKKTSDNGWIFVIFHSSLMLMAPLTWNGHFHVNYIRG